MNTKHLTSLSELEAEVENIKSLIRANRRHKYHLLSRPLFRGHSDKSWELKTTLERYTNQTYSVSDYDVVMHATACATQSFTSQHWQLEDIYRDAESFTVPPNFRFMAHARHHGFPSPLLDWTQSLYVALFFAFSDANPDSDVAIFVYVERLGSGKSGWVGAPEISLLGPYVATHKRHFLQQGQYTISIERKDGTWFYCDHMLALSQSHGMEQDVIYKFTLPGKLRNEMLRRLQEMNITAYTLLGSEESLMSTLAFKEITLREADNSGS